jgi:hypothetical protein
VPGRKPASFCCSATRKYVEQCWERVPPQALLSELPDFTHEYSSGDWVYDAGVYDYFYIEFANNNDLSVTGHYLGGTKQITRDFTYYSENFREASLLELPAADMYKLVGKVIKNDRTGDAEFVFSCSETGNDSELRVCTFKNPGGISASDLLNEWEFLDGKPCGVFCRKDENGEWV